MGLAFGRLFDIATAFDNLRGLAFSLELAAESGIAPPVASGFKQGVGFIVGNDNSETARVGVIVALGGIDFKGVVHVRIIAEGLGVCQLPFRGKHDYIIAVWATLLAIEFDFFDWKVGTFHMLMDHGIFGVKLPIDTIMEAIDITCLGDCIS